MRPGLGCAMHTKNSADPLWPTTVGDALGQVPQLLRPPTARRQLPAARKALAAGHVQIIAPASPQLHSLQPAHPAHPPNTPPRPLEPRARCNRRRAPRTGLLSPPGSFLPSGALGLSPTNARSTQDSSRAPSSTPPKDTRGPNSSEIVAHPFPLATLALSIISSS
jgi:hypothetical protein